MSARNRGKDRGVSLFGMRWVDDPVKLAIDPEIDLFVELIGGADGPALTLARETLGAGKAFVTANKAMLARSKPSTACARSLP